jgi:hypothetical protein
VNRRILSALLCAVIPLPALAHESCGMAKDLMVRALERIKPEAPSGDLEDALQLLKHATEQCANLGDAWYYRALVEKQLGRQSQSTYALGKAKLFHSETADQNYDPFSLAATEAKVPGALRPVRDKWALVIGIGEFHDSALNLQYTTKDAQDFAAALADSRYGRFKKDHVKVLLNEQATTRNIKSELNSLARNAGSDDLVLIYLASHGSPRDAESGGVNYVITYDTDISDPDSLYATALPMIEVVNVVRNRVKARRAVVLLDTCHSGGALPAGGRGIKVAGGVNASAPSSDTLDKMRQGVGRAIVASSQVDESSYESPRLHNGYFTYYLIQSLEQSGGQETIEKMYASVRQGVSARVLADLHTHQTPVMSLSQQVRDIVVGANPEQ